MWQFGHIPYRARSFVAPHSYRVTEHTTSPLNEYKGASRVPPDQRNVVERDQRTVCGLLPRALKRALVGVTICEPRAVCWNSCTATSPFLIPSETQRLRQRRISSGSN